MTNGVDVEETKQKVETYKKENQALIMKNRARQVMCNTVAFSYQVQWCRSCNNIKLALSTVLVSPEVEQSKEY